MGVDIHRYFDGFHKGFLYHIYVTNIDVLCVRMGRDIPAAGYHGGGLVGGLAAGQQQQEALRKYEREVKEETEMLARRDGEGIRTYIKAMKRGYELDPDDLEDVRIDAVGKWKRFLFCKPTPVFIATDARAGKLNFVLPQKKDVVIALYELEHLFGDRLEVGLSVVEYQKALKKYKKIREG